MKFFISGITGSLGKEVSSVLLAEGHSVIGYSRDELKQKELPYHENLTTYLGDIRDERRLLEATRGVDLIFHFAALKHVDSAELQPEECIKTNILGTMNILHAQRIHGISRVVFSSTDKGVCPINVYGSSKQIGERLVLRNPNNVVCRYGNVLASRGSVLSAFIRQIQETKTVSITDRNMTRFWIRLEAAARFVIRGAIGEVGGLRIPDVKAYPVLDLAYMVAKILGKSITHYEEIGLRPGEKVHEQLRTAAEGGDLFSNDKSLYYKDTEIEKILKPIVESFL